VQSNVCEKHLAPFPGNAEKFRSVAGAAQPCGAASCQVGATAVLDFFPCLFGFVNFASSTWAQKDIGGMVGTVKDSSGAFVANAKVAVTNVEHRQTFSTRLRSHP
jgi:hypothetical protein